MEMSRIRPSITVTMDPELLEWLDRYIARQKRRTNRAAILEELLIDFREKEEAKDEK